MTDTPKDDRDIEARKYRKKPVLIEAIQLTSDVAQFWRVYEFMRSDVQEWDDEPFRIRIRTLEGEMWATEGDWVIKGVQGEFYPCKPDIFAQTYESAARPAPEALPVPAPTSAEVDFIERVAKQKPEKPDYWSTCGQCEHNIWDAEELVEARAKVAAPEALGAAGVTVAELIDALETASEAMDYLGDVLNGMDAVTEEDEQKTEPAFEKVRAILTKSKGEQS